MTRERASIFTTDDALDVSTFAPRAAHELNGASDRAVRANGDVLHALILIMEPKTAVRPGI